MAKGVIPAPPDGFEIEASTPAPPAGFVLEDASPTPPEGFELVTDAPAPATPARASDYAELRAAPPRSALQRFMTGVRESLTPLIGPTENQVLAEGVDMGDGQIVYRPLGGRAASEGFFPSLSHPFVPLPRLEVKRNPREILNDPMWQMMGDVPMITPEVAAAAVNTGVGFMEFAESPLGAATGGIGALGKIVGSTATPRVIAGAYAADIASKTPEAARIAGEKSVTGTPQEAIESMVQLGVNVALPGMLGAHALTPAKPAYIDVPSKVVRDEKIFSEFGDEATTVPTREAKESGPAAATGKGTSAPKGESAPTSGEQTRAAVPPPPEGFVVERRESKVEGQPEQTTVPELPATLHAQVVKMTEGKAPAVLFTPADTIPEWALQDQRFDVVQTPEGKVMFDTAAWTKDEITRLVDNNQMGTVLGYGVPNRPAQATGAVVVRDKAGLELRAVGVDEATAPAVLEAARRYAGEGDTVAIEPLENVISKRLDRTGAGADVRTIDAEAQAAAYAEGKRYREEQARQTVESRESRVESEAAPVARPPSLVTEAHLAQAREAVAQMRGEQVERAPDIFDDLDNVTKQPLRVPAELQDVIDASRERIAQELHQKTWKRLSSAQRKPIDRQLRVSTTEGMAADEVMPGLGEKYAGLTIDDLANAVLDAGEGRLLERKKGDSKEVLAMAEEIARAEAMRPATETKGAKETNPEIDPWQETIEKANANPDRIEQWFDDAINKVEFGTDWTKHTSMGLAQLPVWLTQEAAALALKAAKVAYTSTRDLAAAVKEGVATLRGLGIRGMDETQATIWLTDTLRERATGKRLQQSAAFSDDVKRRMTDLLYERRPQDTESQLAAKMLEELGVPSAIETVAEKPDWLPGSLRVALAVETLQRLNLEEARARQQNDAAALDAAVSQGGRLASVLVEQATDPAQTVAAYRLLAKVSPDMFVARARREVEAAGYKKLKRQEESTNAMRDALEKGRTNGIEAVRQDAETNQAAREAVNEAIKNSAETQRGIVMELAQPWAQSEYVLNHAREAVRAKANELLNKQPRPAGFTPAQHLRQILDDLAARAAGIFAGHIQGSEPAVSLVDKLMQRLGVDRPQAVKLASSLSKEWDRQLDLARSKLDVRLASARARQERREREAESNAAVDRALRRQLRELNLKLGDAIRQAASDRQRTGAHMADAIVQASGLTGAKADALRQRLQERYDELVAEAQRNALAAIENRAGIKVRGPMREAFDKLIEIDRLAPVSGDAFFKTVRAGLKLPELTEAQARQLRDLVTEAQTKPEGWQRQRVIAKALTLVEQAKGAYAWQSVPFSIWYANIFSAPPTHLANLIGNSIKALEVVGVNALTRPTQLPALLRSFARGVETGGLEAASIALTGNVEGSRLLKAEASRPLEARIAEGGWNKAWLPWAAVGRALAAEDVLFFKGHEEVKWNMLARRIAKEEGLRGAQLDARVQDLLHNTRAEYEAAKVQAATELASGRVQQWKEKPLSLGKAYDAAQEAIDIRRRAHEIIEQRREASMPGSTDIARQFALEHTFNSQPYGVMGAIAETLNTMNSKLVVTRFAVPVVRIVANLANESLNYFPPVGLARVTVPRWRSDILERSAGDKQALEYATARAVAGTVLFGALAALVYQGANDPDAKVEITGRGPRSKNARTQLASTGWKPNAIRIGDRWYSYQESHLSLPLAILGNYSDAMKYEGMDQKDALNRVGFTMQSTLNTIFTQRMLSGVHDLIAMMDDQGNGKELGNFLARSTASFAVPNALRFVDQAFDPAVYEADDVKAALYAQTPFVRRQNRPALNALGEPVERGPMDRFTTGVKPDALMTVLAQKNAWIPMPNLDEQTVGGNSDNPGRPMSPDEYYTWIATSGPQIRAKLTENLDKLVSLTPEEAKAYVRKIAVEERRKTKPKE